MNRIDPLIRRRDARRCQLEGGLDQPGKLLVPSTRTGVAMKLGDQSDREARSDPVAASHFCTWTKIYDARNKMLLVNLRAPGKHDGQLTNGGLDKRRKTQHPGTHVIINIPILRFTQQGTPCIAAPFSSAAEQVCPATTSRPAVLYHDSHNVVSWPCCAAR